jgi:carbon monoxide dehydrogenase subunit G
MNLEYNGAIPVPVADAWAVLNDLERVAACLPGVRLDQVAGDEVAGTVTVPLGPLRLTYRGEAAFVERDPDARRVVIDAAGRDSHGQQAASARVTVQLREAGGGTEVTAVADVNVRGMSAPVGFAVREFGTGLLREFVTRIGTARRTAAGAATEPEPGGRRAAASPTGAEPDGAGAEAGGPSQPAVPEEAGMRRGGTATDANRQPRRVPQPRPGPSPQLGVAHGPEDAVYPVPPPGEGAALPAAAQFAPYAGALAVGVLIGWLAGRRRR